VDRPVRLAEGEASVRGGPPVRGPPTEGLLLGLASKGWKGDSPFGRRPLERIGSILGRFGIALDKALGDTAYGNREIAARVEALGGMPRGRRATIPLGGGWSSGNARTLRVFGPTVPSRRQHNQNIEVLGRFLLWNYGGLDLR